MPQLNLDEPAPGTAPSVRSVLVLEVFAGSARISQACLAYGFQVTPIDSPGIRSAVLDLRNVGEQILLLEIIHRCQPLMIWMAPPCGTSSRARECRVDPASGLPPSRPLRSEMFPDGLPDLYPAAAARVRSANELYAFTAILIEAARDISLLGGEAAVASPGMAHILAIASCSKWCHERNALLRIWRSALKRTGLLSDRQLPALVRQCAGDHPHLPWRGTEGFRTAEETAYPPSFSKRIAAFCLAEAEARGFQPVPASLAHRGVANRPQQCLRHTRQLLQQLMWREQLDQVPKCSMHHCLKALFWPMCSAMMTPGSF